MTPEEVEVFQETGKGILTSFALVAETLKKFADSFEVRGGTPTFGNDALEIVVLSNTLQSDVLTPGVRATIARLRTDI